MADRTLEELRLQAETLTQLAKRVRRDATMVVQAAAKLESMAAENVDQEENDDRAHSRTEDE